MWFHPQTAFHRLSRPLTEALYRDVPAIVVYGEHVKRALLEVPGVEREKIFVAGQAVDASRFAGVQPARNGRPVVLFVGQFEERKGIDDLLAAFDRVTDPVAELRLVGNGSMEEQIRRRINGSSRVTIVGHVPQDDLPRELERATCLVLPSVTTRETNEPWGLVVNEAMHAGLPVVATDAVGAAVGGLVRDGQNGYVVPERNPDRLGDAMQRLLADRDRRPAWGVRLASTRRSSTTTAWPTRSRARLNTPSTTAGRDARSRRAPTPDGELTCAGSVESSALPIRSPSAKHSPVRWRQPRAIAVPTTAARGPIPLIASR